MIWFLLVSFLIYVAVDLVWIFWIMGNFYKQQFGPLFIQNPTKFSALAGLGAWALLTLGLYWFVLPQAKSYTDAALYGAAFGAVVYGVYDLTNFATLYRWPLTLLFTDWAWGMVVNAIMAVVMLYLKNLLG